VRIHVVAFLFLYLGVLYLYISACKRSNCYFEEITIFNFRHGLLPNGEKDKDPSADIDSRRLTYAEAVCQSENEDNSIQRDRIVLRGHMNNIPNIAFSPCGTFLVSSSMDCSCRIWNVRTGESILSRFVSGFW
jgi:WD40 repeat protein